MWLEMFPKSWKMKTTTFLILRIFNMVDHIGQLIPTFTLSISYKLYFFYSINTSWNRQGSLSIANKLNLRSMRLGSLWLGCTSQSSTTIQGRKTPQFSEQFPDPIFVMEEYILLPFWLSKLSHILLYLKSEGVASTNFNYTTVECIYAGWS